MMNIFLNPPEQGRMVRLEEAVAAWSGALFRFAVLRGAPCSDAEDIVQDAFLKFASAPGPIRHTKAYLYRCVANACNDLLRRRRPSEPLSPTLAVPEEEQAAEDEVQRLATLLNRIPEEQAEVIRLHTFASMRFTEIAQTLELPVTTVKSRFHYGIERLKKLM